MKPVTPIGQTMQSLVSGEREVNKNLPHRKTKTNPVKCFDFQTLEIILRKQKELETISKDVSAIESNLIKSGQSVGLFVLKNEDNQPFIQLLNLYNQKNKEFKKLVDLFNSIWEDRLKKQGINLVTSKNSGLHVYDNFGSPIIGLEEIYITDGIAPDHGLCRGNAVALKQIAKIDPTAYQQFKEEYEILRNHKNSDYLVGFAYDPNNINLILVSPIYMRSLEEELKQQEGIVKVTCLSYLQKMNILQEIAEGMAFLHRNNILHLDLNPTNILLLPDLTVKIKTSRIDQSPFKDSTYFAPDKESSVKSDVFSFGVIILAMLVDLPHCLNSGISKTTTKDNLSKLYQCELLQKEIVDLVHSCLKEDPNERPSFSSIADAKLFRSSYEETVVRSKSILNKESISNIWKMKNGSPPLILKEFGRLLNVHPEGKEIELLRRLISPFNLETFQRVYGIYEPFYPEGIDDQGTLSQMLKFCGFEFFWGEISTSDIPIQKPGSFLIRHSGGSSVFTLSYCNKQKQINHVRLGKFETVYGDIELTIKQFALSSFMTNRPIKFKFNVCVTHFKGNDVLWDDEY